MNIVVRMLSGSHLYGTNTPESDVDYKAIHLPPALDILLQRAVPSIKTSTKSDGDRKNTAVDIDSESLSLQQYMYDLLAGQAVALSMLFTPNNHIEVLSELWQTIQGSKDRWLHRNIKPMLSFCRSWASRARLPPKSGSEVDWKSLGHAVRVCGEAEELLLQHTITYPRPDAALLLEIKSGRLGQDEVAGLVEGRLRRLEDCLAMTTLPGNPDSAAADRLVAKHYRLQVINADTITPPPSPAQPS